MAIIASDSCSLVLALCLLPSFGPSRRCSGGNSPDSQHEGPDFSPGVFHMGFVVCKITVRQVYLTLFTFLSIIILPVLHRYIYLSTETRQWVL